jgi:hypothetical protein
MPERHATPASLPWVRFSYADSDLARTTRKPFRFRASSFVDVPIAAQNSDKGFGLVPSMHAHFPLIERRRAWADFACRGVCLIPECELFSSEAQG